jgi:RNA polymerase sigma-70 factor (ECF subfamily)
MTAHEDARSDADLLAAARAGDRAAIEALVARYQTRVFRFGVRMCGNSEDGGDVAQETLLAMARSLDRFRGDAELSTWLYTIARRFCIKKRRRSRFAPAREESLDSPDAGAARHLADPRPDPEQTATNRELATALTDAIDALEPSQREVLVLRDVEGLSAPEAARILGVSVDAVKSRLHRARVAIRRELAPALGHPIVRGASCPDVLTLFSQHLDGEIDPGVCATMEAHLARCHHCRDACESLKRTLAICRQLPTPDVPASLAASVKAAIAAFLDQRQGP